MKFSRKSFCYFSFGIKCFFVTILLYSCQKPKSKYSAPPELDKIARSFVNEALKRGIKINLDSSMVTLSFERLGIHYNGSCTPNADPKVIIIDSFKWNTYDSTMKEFIVFHELGHCLLNRGHKNDTLKLGECVSIMREGLTSCNSNYADSAWRDFYLDELFNSSVPKPEWYDTNLPKLNFTVANTKSTILINNKIFEDTLVMDDASDFEIELQTPTIKPRYFFLFLMINDSGIYMTSSVNAEKDSIQLDYAIVTTSKLNNKASWKVLDKKITSRLPLAKSYTLSFKKDDDKLGILLNDKLVHVIKSSQPMFNLMAHTDVDSSRLNISVYQRELPIIIQ
jgi:hypothetical protein